MTAAYMTRCVYLTFFGEYRGGARATRTPTDAVDELVEHDPPTDATPGRRTTPTHARDRTRATGSSPAPLWVLSFFAVFAGFFNFPHFEKFEQWFQPRFRGSPTCSRTATFNSIARDRLGRRSRSPASARRVGLLLEGHGAAAA